MPETFTSDMYIVRGTCIVLSKETNFQTVWGATKVRSHTKVQSKGTKGRLPMSVLYMDATTHQYSKNLVYSLNPEALSMKVKLCRDCQYDRIYFDCAGARDNNLSRTQSFSIKYRNNREKDPNLRDSTEKKLFTQTLHNRGRSKKVNNAPEN